jgi:hypothetical protein
MSIGMPLKSEDYAVPKAKGYTVVDNPGWLTNVVNCDILTVKERGKDGPL